MRAKRKSSKMPRTKLADYARWFSSRGGKARAKALSAEERSEGARQAALARWARKKKPAK